MTMASEVAIEREDRLAIVTVNRPGVLNALNVAVLEEMRMVLRHLAEDEEVGVVILTGAGKKAFIAGADIKEMSLLSPMEMEAFSRLGQDVADLLQRMEKPTIAAINGFALGGGCEIAMACDIRIMAETAQIGLPEVSLGIVSGFGGTQRALRLVGRGWAAHMIFTADRLDAATAERIRLVEKVVPPSKLLDEARAVAHRILARGPISIKLSKRALNLAAEVPLAEGLRYEAEIFGLISSTKDRQEGMRAFIEKRKPRFKGE